MELKEIDFETISDIWATRLWDGRKDIYPTNNITYLGGRNNDIEKSSPTFFGVYDESKIVGVNSCFETPNKTFRSRGLWVDPDYRGKGIGRDLLTAVINVAKKNRSSFIWSIPRESALDCYLSAGFTQTSEFFDEGMEYGPNCYVKMDLQNNSYCPLPFIHLSTLPSGQTRLCCKAVDNHVPDGNLNNKSVEEIWNNEYYETIRDKMMKGEYPEDCRVCYDEDNRGKRSMRIKELERWGYREKQDTPTYIDLRMGNLCNLKCRTCDPVSSSQIHKESKQYDYTPVFFRQKMNEAESIKPWWERKEFLNLAGGAELIWLSGGEPTLVPAGKEMIDHCIDNNLSENIDLRYVVNLTNITEDFMKKFEKFRKVDIHCSIDGIGEVNDYLRFPSKFHVLADNLDKLQYAKVNELLMIHTVSLFNIYRVPEMIEWLENNYFKVKLNLNPLNEPRMYHPNILDEGTKEMIKNKLSSYKPKREKNKKEIDSLIRLMYNDTAAIENSRKHFKNFVDQIDKIRGQSFIKTFPELENFYRICSNG